MGKTVRIGDTVFYKLELSKPGAKRILVEPVKPLEKHLAYSLAVFVVLASAAAAVWGCYDPSNASSIEVVLNKPGLDYDLAVLDGMDNVARTGGAYVYRSHYSGDIVVAVGLQPIVLGRDAPRYLSVRVEAAGKGVGGEELRNALAQELEWLASIGVVKGLTQGDIEAIREAARPGLAGWNDRLIYHEGGWHPYSQVFQEIEGAALVKMAGCSWSYDPSQVPLEPPPKGQATTTSEAGSGMDGAVVLASLALGLAAALLVGVAIRRI